MQDEIHAAVGGKDRVHLDDMPKLRHLKWVVKETLRCTRSCHTCCPGESLRHITICSYDVLMGTGDRQGPDQRLGGPSEPHLRCIYAKVHQQTSIYAKVQLAVFHHGATPRMYLYVLGI